MTATHDDRSERAEAGNEARDDEYDARGETPPPRQPKNDTKRPFRGEWLKDVSYRFEPELIDGILPAAGLGFLYGASSAGKSFIAIDWALSLVSGKTVLDRVTMRSGVLYIAAEGQAGMRKRVVAARSHHDLDDADMPFHYLPAFVDLADPDAEEIGRVFSYARECSVEMEEFGAPLRLVIIDTMAAAAPSVDENTAKDMGPLIFGLQKLAADLNCLVLVILK
jgi:RecA-family ATPase